MTWTYRNGDGTAVIRNGEAVRTVKVLLNRQKDESDRLAIFSRYGADSGYHAGDELEEVFSYGLVAETVDGALNRAFSDFNRGSPTFVGDEKYPQRSVSVGDVFEVDGVRYAVANVGFTEVA